MAHQVKVRSPVRGICNKFKVEEYCLETGLYEAFESTITGNRAEWSKWLDEDGVDVVIVTAIKRALGSGGLKDRIEDDLRQAYNLSDDWDHKDSMWDDYREAVAASLLRIHRERHP